MHAILYVVGLSNEYTCLIKIKNSQKDLNFSKNTPSLTEYKFSYEKSHERYLRTVRFDIRFLNGEKKTALVAVRTAIVSL